MRSIAKSDLQGWIVNHRRKLSVIVHKHEYERQTQEIIEEDH